MTRRSGLFGTALALRQPPEHSCQFTQCPARNATKAGRIRSCFQQVLIRRATCERLLHFSRAVTRAQAATAFSCSSALSRFPRERYAQARMEFIPSMSLFTVYDDNIFARVDGSAGQMLQLRPSFEGSYESPTRQAAGPLLLRHAAVELLVAEHARRAPPRARRDAVSHQPFHHARP